MIDSTQIALIATVGVGTIFLTLSVLRTMYTKSINNKVEMLIMMIQDGMEIPKQSEIQPQIQPMPVQVPVQPQPMQIQPQMPQIVPQPVVKPNKQDFAARVKEMNEGKKRKRLEREMAALQAQMPK